MSSSPFFPGILIFSLLTQIYPTIGHGFVHEVIINGQTLPAWSPFADNFANPAPPRVGRKIPSDGPVTSVSDPNLACNVGGSAGTSVVADVDAGSAVTFLWQYWPGDHRGLVSSYMTACSNNDCPSFDPQGAQWFKLDAAGYQDGKWASENLIANNFSWKSTVPAGLAGGQYLIRHEIIALHSAYQPQFYPVCIQVNVVGSGTNRPSAQEMTAIPGLYDNTKWPNIDTQFGEFPIPGPPVVFSDGNPGAPPAPPSPALSTAATRPSPTSAPPSAPSNSSIPRPAVASPVGRCRLVRRASH